MNVENGATGTSKTKSYNIIYTTNFMAVCGGPKTFAGPLRNVAETEGRRSFNLQTRRRSHLRISVQKTPWIFLGITSRYYPWTSNTMLSASYPFYSKMFHFHIFTGPVAISPSYTSVSPMTIWRTKISRFVLSSFPSPRHRHRADHRQITAPRMHLESANPIPLRPPNIGFLLIVQDDRKIHIYIHCGANDKVAGRVQCRGGMTDRSETAGHNCNHAQYSQHTIEKK